MWTTHLKRACGVWTVVLSVTSAALAAEHPIEAIPESAGVVLRLKQPQQTVERMSKFVQNVEPAMVQQVQQLSAMSGILISNPAQAGVDSKGDWWAVVFVEGESQPKVAFAVPTTDADAMKQAVGEQFHFATYENWTLYSQDEATIKRIQDRISGEGESIHAKVDEATISAFDAGDVSLYVNVDHLAEAYRDKLDEAEGQIDVLIDQISSMTPPNSGVNMEAIWDMYRNLAHGLVQAVRDTRGLTVTVAFNPQNVLIEEFVSMKSGTQSAEYLAGHPGSSLELMEKLPANKLIYYGFHGDMDELMQMGIDMSQKIVQNQNEETTKALKNIQEEYKKLKLGDMVGALSLGALETGIVQNTNILEVSPTEKMQQIVREMLPALSKMEIEGFKQTVEIQKDAEKFGDLSADVQITKQEVDPDLDPTGMQQKLMEIMYGPDGVTSRYVYTEGKMVQVIGHGREGMEEALAALKNGSGKTVGASETFKSVREQVGKSANFVALLDLARLGVEAGIRIAESGEFPVPFDAESLKELDIQPSYIGFSIATESQALRCRTSITAAQVKAIVKLVQFSQTMQQRGRL